MAVRIINADVMDGLAQLPDESVNCVVTSPPYWGLRDYGVDGQIGLESTPDAFVAKMVEVFRNVRRVLRDDGTLWLNLGDSYNAAGRVGHGSRDPKFKQATNRASAASVDECRPSDPGLKPKDLIGIPWRVALALQADGWYLRSDIIWHKPNPMPESATDRPTKSHEYVFLMSKSEKYWYDAEAIKEDAKYLGPNGAQQSPYAQGFGRRTPEEEQSRRARKTDGHENRRYDGFNDRWDAKEREGNAPITRNKRSVWTIATAPFSEAHFARSRLNYQSCASRLDAMLAGLCSTHSRVRAQRLWLRIACNATPSASS